MKKLETYSRQMNTGDIDAVKELIEKVLQHKSMSKVYEASETATWLSCYNDESISEILRTSNVYLLLNRATDKVIASGYIKPCGDNKTVHIGMIFSDPDYRREGLGKKIIGLLEEDTYAKSAERIELLSSMGAYRFYKSLGYDNKDGEYQIEKELDTYGVPMEKYLKR